MGTRGLVGFVVENQVKASYNHYDSYPSGVGVEVLDFARKIADVIALRKAVAKVKTLDDESKKPTVAQQKKLREAGYEPQGVSSGDDWYAWLREDQGNLDRLSKAPYMTDASSFGEDSLFCEWGYLVNTDEQTLEVYTGFQQHQHSDGRWAHVPANRGYYGIRLVKTYSLGSDLPTDEAFVAEVEAAVNALTHGVNA